MLKQGKEALRNAREERVPPALDDKVLLSWNALMNLALTKAGVTLGDLSFLEKSRHHLDWMLKTYKGNGQLKRVYKDGVTRLPATLEDYAYLIKALLEYASAAAQPQYCTVAEELMDDVFAMFADGKSDFFFFSSLNEANVPTRRVELYDTSMPSANSMISESLVILGNLLENTDWIARGKRMANQMQSAVSRSPLAFSNWAIMLQRQAIGQKQLIIAGEDAKNVLEEWNSCHAPEVFALVWQKDLLPIFKDKAGSGKIVLYLCEGYECRAPVGSLEELFGRNKKKR